MLEPVALLHDKERLKGPHDIELQGDLAFVAGKWGAFAILDVSDPERPEILSTITTGMDDPETPKTAQRIIMIAIQSIFAFALNPQYLTAMPQFRVGRGKECALLPQLIEWLHLRRREGVELNERGMSPT